ncbi:hypothetical protein C8J57DRAFT_1233947 [Mycena rebaudengoi]|nr:hypothetical protein C8J57DRAFT_1233947 [Mycena rebaudengoi]
MDRINLPHSSREGDAQKKYRISGTHNGTIQTVSQYPFHDGRLRGYRGQQIFALGFTLVLQESVNTARWERDNLQSQIDEYKYPVLTLPVEITTEISLAYLPAYPECPPLTGHLSPAFLGQICMEWRQIAYSLEAQLNVLKTWLSRSKGCALLLSFTKSRIPAFSDLPHFTDTLISHSARWEHVELYLPFNQLDWMAGPFPRLRHLSTGPGIVESTAAHTLFHDAPHLTSVLLAVDFDPSEMILPWSQLTSIDTERIYPALMAHILRKLPPSSVCAAPRGISDENEEEDEEDAPKAATKATTIAMTRFYLVPCGATHH